MNYGGIILSCKKSQMLMINISIYYTIKQKFKFIILKATHSKYFPQSPCLEV